MLFGRSRWQNEAHVGLVDAHAEGDGGDDHHAVFIDEAILIGLTQACVEPGVIGQREDAGLVQCSSGVLDLGTRQAIDHAGLAGMPVADESLQRLRVRWS